MEQIEMEKIDYINTRMDKNYEYITEVLSYFHDQIVANSEDAMSNAALVTIGEIAQKMIDTQIAYIDVHCAERSYAENTIRKLTDRKNALLNALAKDQQIGKIR